MNTMRFRIGIMSLLALGALTACDDDDDDYTIYTDEIITTIESVSATVTATSATVTSTVLDLSGMSTTSYEVGVCYATTNDNSSATEVTGSLDDDGTLTTELTGLSTGVTYYYWTYVTLQDKVTKYSEASTFVTTDAEIATADAAYSAVTATLSGTLTVETTDNDVVVKGIYVGLDESALSESRLYTSDETGNSYTIVVEGLVPSQTYYYESYSSVNDEEFFGEVKSFTTEDQDVEFVDLGLSVEWATVNVGATSPEEAGGLYGYGDNTLFNISTSIYDYIDEDIQATEYDIASMYITAGFTPTADEWEELLSNTTQEYTTKNDVAGYLFTSTSNGESIFLPLTGVRSGETVSNEDAIGAYWSASVDDVDSEYGEALSFTSSGVSMSSAPRYEGLAIRPVRTPSRAMELDYLYKTWSIDLDADGNSVYWDGPLYYYGTDDSWNTVTNGYTIEGDTWNWCPVYSENTWIATAMDHGTMTFNEDGTVEVNDKSNGVTYSGTYTVDTENYTITLYDAEILHLSNFDELVTNWSTDLKIMSLSEKGLQIAALRDNSDEGECLLVHNYVDTELVGGAGSEEDFDNTKLLYGDIEGNGNFRLEIYNEWGSGSASDPGIDGTTLTFSKNLAVTFTLEGVTLNDDAAGMYDAYLVFADYNWALQQWSADENPKYNAEVTGDGTYTVFIETDQTVGPGVYVFCIDIVGLASDVADVSAITATINSIVTDTNTDNLYETIEIDNSKVLFNNKDGNGTDGRIEIYNEYGDTQADPGVSQEDIYFAGRMTMTFTISGIDGNLVDGADGSYLAEISFADADWSPSYWGGGAVGSAYVTGDGTYTVYADMGSDTAEGVVVWCIELYNLWKDLVDTSLVTVNIDEVAVEPAD